MCTHMTAYNHIFINNRLGGRAELLWRRLVRNPRSHTERTARLSAESTFDARTNAQIKRRHKLA